MLIPLSCANDDPKRARSYGPTHWCHHFFKHLKKPVKKRVKKLFLSRTKTCGVQGRSPLVGDLRHSPAPQLKGALPLYPIQDSGIWVVADIHYGE